MPWIQTNREMERRKFVQAALRREVSMADVCQRFGISRKTGYKILARHAALGLAGLKDGSRAPKVHPNQTRPEVEAAVLRVRKAHPTWGSKKILWTLDRERPDEDWPARSTVEEILKRAGLVEPRDRRLRRQPSSPPKVEAAAPNDGKRPTVDRVMQRSAGLRSAKRPPAATRQPTVRPAART